MDASTGPTGPTGPTGTEAPYLSGYLEAAGTAQTVPAGGDVIFDEVDVVGTGISITAPGSTIRIDRPGLYLVEWSLNLAAGNAAPTLVGILEDGEPASALTNSATVGNTSSGSLIYVDTVPFILSLHNFSASPLVLAIVTDTGSTAASIRVLRFADGPSIV